METRLGEEDYQGGLVVSDSDGGGGGERESSDNGWEGGDNYRKKMLFKGRVRGSCTLVVGVLPFHALQDEALCQSSSATSACTMQGSHSPLRFPRREKG
ncbi:hypothetical protein B296_00044656 [Ensete ventricosum]|uniref:Uncharacterized protein n=1 Tax=Ensete ventricosum TaxID=4639 RepID=A0A426XXR5_ENSVE|nr:hypothetical protein B296_00044656 [Ensete ventricosum]